MPVNPISRGLICLNKRKDPTVSPKLNLSLPFATCHILFSFYSPRFLHPSLFFPFSSDDSPTSSISNYLFLLSVHFFPALPQLLPWVLAQPIQNEDPKINILQRKRPLFYHQIGNTIFFIFFTNQLNLMFCVDKINNKHLAFLSDLKSCQFALRIVIFNICIGCQFEDLQIILPKIIPMSHRNN